MSIAQNDGILKRVNDALSGLDDEIALQSGVSEVGPVFIVGLHRSGTSLLNQMIINRFGFSYPSNLVARFWKAPAVGMALWKSLATASQMKLPLESRYGSTSGVDEPHEFGWFWREYFPTSTIMDPAGIDDPKFGLLAGKISALGQLAGRPLLFKNLVQLSLNTRALKRVFPSALFIRMNRIPFFVIQSTLKSRKGCYGHLDSWFGVIPPEHRNWESLSPEEQVVRQVRTVEQYLDNHFRDLPPEDVLSVDYESLLSRPGEVLSEIGSALSTAGIRLEERDQDLSALISGNRVSMDREGIDRVFAACRSLGMEESEAQEWLGIAPDGTFQDGLQFKPTRQG